MNKNKKYSLMLLLICVLGLGLMSGITIYVDPYFHYHKPNDKFSYILDNERYQNDGIMRHWEYDTMIIGSSMTENFKTSELDTLFGSKSIKVPFSGASYKEINDNIERALSYNSDIKMIIRALDYSMFWTSADYYRYDKNTYPEYLTNNNVFDDVYYLFNKETFLNDVYRVLGTYNEKEKFITSFDAAYNWNNYYTFSKEAVLATYTRPESVVNETALTEEEIKEFHENIDRNIVQTVKENPDIEFYYFLTPYSICYWDELRRTGSIGKQLLGERMIIEALLPYDNVHLFSFTDDFELTTDLNNYKDIAHYGQHVNSYMLTCMDDMLHCLTEDNYETYLSRIEEFYRSYNYEVIFE